MSATHPTTAAVDTGAGDCKFTCITDQPGPVVVGSFPAIAPVVSSSMARGSEFDRADVRFVEVGRQLFAVGPDAILFTGPDYYAWRDHHFATTDECHALTLGSLAYGGHRQVTRLVVGLPVPSFKTLRQSVAQRLTGAHRVGDVTIEVESVEVLPQALGALVHYDRSMPTLRLGERITLTLDLGYHALTAMVMRGGLYQRDRLQVVPGGMARAYVDLDRALETHFAGAGHEFSMRDQLHRYAHALRQAQPVLPTSRGRIDLEPFYPALTEAVRVQVAHALAKADDWNDVDYIVLAGGGARWLRDALDAYPGLRHRIVLRIEDAAEAQVRGYYHHAVR